jgi:hypothetical protein
MWFADKRTVAKKSSSRHSRIAVRRLRVDRNPIVAREEVLVAVQ